MTCQPPVGVLTIPSDYLVYHEAVMSRCYSSYLPNTHVIRQLDTHLELSVTTNFPFSLNMLMH
jgi:hypothetical protein